MTPTIAHVTISGITPLSHSRQHDEPKLDGESHEAYDKRTWRAKLNTAVRDGKPTIVIPAHGLHQAIAAAAKYSKRQIPGQGKATWTAKFTAGITLLEDPALNIDPATIRASYLDRVKTHLKSIELACGQMKADYVPVNTKTPVTEALFSYFSQRK